MNQVPRGEKITSGYVMELKPREEKEPIASFLKMRLLELNPDYALAP